MWTLDIKWRRSLERYFQSITAEAQTVAGVGWHCMGLGAQGAQGGGRLSAGMEVLAAQTQAAFSAGSAKTEGWQWSWQKWQPWDPQRRNWEMERTWGGSRDFQGMELEDGQEESLAGVCSARALSVFVNTVQGTCPSVSQ